MTLFIRLADVPNEILERVKARILANRRRSRDQRRSATRPREERSARRRYYSPLAADRRPEPGAVHLNPIKAWLLAPSDPELNAKTRGIPPFRFTQDQQNTEPFIFSPGGGPGGQPYIEGAPGSTISAATGQLPVRKKPASRAVTEECFFYISNASDSPGDTDAFSSSVILELTTCFISCQTSRNRNDDGASVVRLVQLEYVETGIEVYRYFVSSFEPEDANAFDIPEYEVDNARTAYGWHHAACVVVAPGEAATVSLYLDGQRILESDPLPADRFWERYESSHSVQLSTRGFGKDPNVASHRIAGVRCTERALYTGDTYEVPTSITSLS